MEEKQEINSIEEIIINRVENNKKIFNEKEINTIKSNIKISSKLYLLGYMDNIEKNKK